MAFQGGGAIVEHPYKLQRSPFAERSNWGRKSHRPFYRPTKSFEGWWVLVPKRKKTSTFFFVETQLYALPVLIIIIINNIITQNVLLSGKRRRRKSTPSPFLYYYHFVLILHKAIRITFSDENLSLFFLSSLKCWESSFQFPAEQENNSDPNSTFTHSLKKTEVDFRQIKVECVLVAFVPSHTRVSHYLFILPMNLVSGK